MKNSSPTSESGPRVTPWKELSQESRPGRPVAARANFIAESTASAPVLAKKSASRPGGSRCASASASIPASGRVVDLHAVGETRGERRLEHSADVGVVVAEAREALAGVEVEMGAAAGVVEVGAARRDVLAVEAEDREHVDQRRVQMARGELERLARARERVGDDIERVAAEQ